MKRQRISLALPGLIILSVVSIHTSAATLEIFINARNNINGKTLIALNQSGHKIIIHDLDSLAEIHAEINQGVVIKSEKERDKVQKHLEAIMTDSFKESIAKAWTAKHRAELFDIQMLPAAVIDGVKIIQPIRNIEELLNHGR